MCSVFLLKPRASALSLQPCGLNTKPSVLVRVPWTNRNNRTYIQKRRDLFLKMGSCHCGSWLATQMGVDIAVLNQKAGNANGISKLPSGGGILPFLEVLNFSPKALN